MVNGSALINVPNDAVPGVYDININTQDSTGAPSHSLTIALTVLQDFSLSLLTPSTQTITAGQSASYNFSVLPVGASFSANCEFFLFRPAYAVAVQFHANASHSWDEFCCRGSANFDHVKFG